MASNTKRPEEFFEENDPVPVLLHGAKFTVDKEGNRIVRIDFEAAAAEVEPYLPDDFKTILKDMMASSATKIDFGVEYASRMVEVFFNKKGKASLVIDCTSITRVGFRRPDAQHFPLLRFSVTENVREVGHWVVDHYGDPMYFHSFRTQMELDRQK